MAGNTSNNARVREALAGPPTVKDKTPPVADGVLSVTPDTPEVAEWRSKQSMDCVATTSTYLEDEDGERRSHLPRLGRLSRPTGPTAAVETAAKKPQELFGKFTWKIDNFSDISKRELRSNQFDVGEYKWCVSRSFAARACAQAAPYTSSRAPAGTSSCIHRAATSATICPCSYA